MIQQSVARVQPSVAAGRPAWKAVEARLDDAQDLSTIPDNSASHVLGSLVYFLLPNPRKALEAARRVLTTENSGGVFAMSAMIDAEWVRTRRFRQSGAA